MKTKQLISQAFLAAALLLSSSALFAQVKIGTNPTVIDPANNLEVQGSTAGRKVAVDKLTGKVTIADGSEGVGKILTSDANGIATWQTQSSLAIPVTVFSGAITSTATIPAWTAHDLVTQRLPLVPTVGGSGWDASTKRWTTPADGTYSVQVGLSCNSTTGAGVALWTRIWVLSENGGPLFKGISPMGAPAGDWQSVVYTGKLLAGDGISLEGYTMQTDGNPPVNPVWTGTCNRAYMTVTKID